MERTTTPGGRARSLSAADWIAAATDALVEGGVGAVQVEALAVRLGATKGSFYHHFANRDALITAALEDWERRTTTEVGDRLALIADPRARIQAVMTAAIADREGGLRDAALLSSGSHPLVAPVVARATAARVAGLTEAYVQLGLPRPAARRRALLTSVAYVGLFEYLRNGGVTVSDAELRAYADEMLAALVPPPGGAS